MAWRCRLNLLTGPSLPLFHLLIETTNTLSFKTLFFSNFVKIRYWKIKSHATCERDNSPIGGIKVSLVCNKAKLWGCTSMHNRYTHGWALSGPHTHIHTCRHARLIMGHEVHLLLSYCTNFSSTTLSFAAAHIHTQLTPHLFQCSSKGHLFRASEAEVASGGECKLPFAHTHTAHCQVPLLSVPHASLNRPKRIRDKRKD